MSDQHEYRVSVTWQFAEGKLESEMAALMQLSDPFPGVYFEPADGADQVETDIEVSATSIDEAIAVALDRLFSEALKVGLRGNALSVWATDDIQEVTRNLDEGSQPSTYKANTKAGPKR